MPFNNLSNDVLLEILDLLRDDFFEGTRSLHSLALTSKRLNVLATPVLYSKFCLPHVYTLKHLVVFLQVITERPDLRYLVKEIVDGCMYCGGHCVLSFDSDSDLSSLPDVDALLRAQLSHERGLGCQTDLESQKGVECDSDLKNEGELESQHDLEVQTDFESQGEVRGQNQEPLQSVWPPKHTEEHLLEYRKLMEGITSSAVEVEEWIEVLLGGHWHAVFGLLLLSLPNLKRIQVKSHGSEDTMYVDLILRTAIKNQTRGQQSSFLKLLKSVSLGDEMTDTGMPIHKIIPWLKLETGSQLWANLAIDDGDLDQDRVDSNVKELTLTNSYIDGDSMITLLRTLPKLRVFEYTACIDIYSPSCFFPQKIGDAISHLKPVLEKLSLDSNELFKWEFEDLDPGFIGSLVRFEKLHTLCIDADALLGPTMQSNDYDNYDYSEDKDEDEATLEKPRLVDVLPKSLRTLTLLNCSCEVGYQVQELLSRKDEVVPLLTSLTLKVTEIFEEDEVHMVHAMVEDLKEECKSASVTFYLC
jgi:hypothetical protein